MARSITISDPNPAWRGLFLQERQRLWGAVGAWAVSIQHIGSTAVPGLAAKPVLDILVGVRSLAEADGHARAAVEALGYRYVPEYEAQLPERRFLYREEAGRRHCNLHMVVMGSVFWRDHTLFPAYLRHHDDVAQAYAEHKRYLAQEHTDVDAYARAKSSFIQAALADARLWRAQASPCLRTERLQLRPWTTDDLPMFRTMNADPEVMEHMPKALSPRESAVALHTIQQDLAAEGFGLWAVQPHDSDEAVGWAGLNVPDFDATFTPCVEVSWRLQRDAWGQGYATEAAHAALTFAFTEVGLLEVVAFTVPANLRSLRVMEKVGMERDAQGDFAHPSLPADHPLSRHVLYRMPRPANWPERF